MLLGKLLSLHPKATRQLEDYISQSAPMKYRTYRLCIRLCQTSQWCLLLAILLYVVLGILLHPTQVPAQAIRLNLDTILISAIVYVLGGLFGAILKNALQPEVKRAIRLGYA
ncbi:hypothetical protein [Chitinivorax sp. B]|uniref:hypothetical protein n=1 Tax=Chitinivorax sp. B TaxID=2502235 RepID=UPI0010F43382|nr:hypothetical protein [Chitinivorax sp. B]